MFSISCLLFGHTAQERRKAHVLHSYTQPAHSVSLLGEVTYQPPMYTGLLYKGFSAVCTRCGKTFDATDMKLPEAADSGTDVARFNNEHRQLYLWWCDVTKKHCDASLFLSKKQCGYLWYCVGCITKEHKALTEKQTNTCNDIVSIYWARKKRPNYHRKM